MQDPQQDHWLVRPENIRKLIWWGIGLLVVTAGADALTHHHVEFDGSTIPGFYSAYGFLACAAMVIFAKALGVFLKRKDSYYDRDD